MSRKARRPIILPKGVEVKLDGNIITVKGPKGSLRKELRKEIKVAHSPTEIKMTLHEGYEEDNHYLGLFFTLVSNMVLGVSQGFQRQLEMVGVGYRAAVQGKMLDLQIGTSHPTQLAIPEGIQVGVEKNTQISITGTDKQQVGQYAAVVRAMRPPEPYKGKGIRYVGEYVRKKAGKAGKATAK